MDEGLSDEESATYVHRSQCAPPEWYGRKKDRPFAGTYEGHANTFPAQMAEGHHSKFMAIYHENSKQLPE